MISERTVISIAAVVVGLACWVGSRTLTVRDGRIGAMSLLLGVAALVLIAIGTYALISAY
jgi:hypothetical protein